MASKARRTILLIEDDAILAMNEQVELEANGYRVLLATSGEEALRSVLESNDIDLILADIDLGEGIDGAEAADHILKLKDLPIVFLSSHTDDAIVRKTEILASYGYVVKDSGISVLLASIKMALDRFEAQKLSKSRIARLKRTLEALPDLLFEVGPDGHFYDCSIPSSGFSFKPELDFIGKRVPDVLPSRVARVVMSAIKEAGEKGSSQGKQYEMDGLSGRICFEVSVTYMPGSHEEPRFVLLTRDITARRREEERLLASNRMLQAVLDALPISLAWRDSQSEFLGCNRSFAGLFGLAGAADVVGKAVYEIQGRNSAILEPRIQGSAQVFDAEGRKAWVEKREVALADPAAREEAVLTYFMDISERSCGDGERQAQARLLAGLLGSRSHFICLKDRTSAFVAASPAYAEYLGLKDSSQLVGKTDFDYFCRTWAEKSFEDERRIIDGGSGYCVEEELRARDRPAMQVRTMKFPLKEEDGSASGLFCVSMPLNGH